MIEHDALSHSRANQGLRLNIQYGQGGRYGVIVRRKHSNSLIRIINKCLQCGICVDEGQEEAEICIVCKGVSDS